MKVKIGSKWYESLIEKRALIRGALQDERLENIPIHVLNKGNLIVLVSDCDDRAYRCYECFERIGKREGLRLRIIRTGRLKLTRKPFWVFEEYHFHKYHF
jgi:hypothetical protein